MSLELIWKDGRRGECVWCKRLTIVRHAYIYDRSLVLCKKDYDMLKTKERFSISIDIMISPQSKSSTKKGKK